MSATLPRSQARAALVTLPGVLLRATLIGIVAFIAVCAGSAAGMPTAPVAAPTGADVELSALHAALADLHGEYFRPVDPALALDSAWEGALGALRTAGAAAPSTPRPRVDGPLDTALGRFDSSFRRLAAEETGHIDEHKLGEAAVAGLASAVHESHTYYITPADWSRRSDTGTRYAGIGVTVNLYQGSFYTGDVYSGSPAAGASLRPGDRVTAVDGADATGQTLDWLVTKLRGDPGSTVSMTVERDGVARTATLTRAYIYVPDFEARVLDNGAGYLRLRAFPPASAAQPDGKTVVQALDAALARFDAAGATAWVLDLRGNGGGYLDTMNAFADRLLPPNTAVLVSRTHAGDTTTRTQPQQHRPARPLTVLVDGGSASASEILAAALQENGRARVVGQQSAGVANAANRDALPDGGGLSVTVVQSLTPVHRRVLDGSGVTPDDPIAPSADDIPLGRDRQLDRAATLALAGGATTATAAAK